MFVFDFFSQYSRSSKVQTVAALGSCRTKDSLKSLLPRDKALVHWDLAPLTHTINEADQIIRYFKGDLQFPDFLVPFVFGLPTTPSIPHGARQIIDRVDTFLVEVSEGIQIRYKDVPLQQNFFTQYFIQKNGAQLLEWYRALTTGQKIDEELVARTIDKLSSVQVPITKDLVDLLRHATFVSADAESIKESMKAIMFDPSRRWIFMSHFCLPEMGGDIMASRKQLGIYLAEAASALGAEVFDPSLLIEKYGNKAVLADCGKNIYEYKPEFVPFMGEILSNLISGALPLGQVAERLPANPEIASIGVHERSIESCISFLSKLLTTHHLGRVATLGVKESGLYEHYLLLIQQNLLIRHEHANVLKIIERILPSFDHYVIHKDGLGEFGLLLALRGLPVTVLEPSVMRYEAMKESVRILSEACPEIVPLVTTEIGFFASKAPDPSVRTLAVCMDLSGMLNDEERTIVKICLARYGALLINVRLFLGINDNRESRQRAMQFLIAQGWKLAGEWLDGSLAYFVKGAPHI